MRTLLERVLYLRVRGGLVGIGAHRMSIQCVKYSIVMRVMLTDSSDADD